MASDGAETGADHEGFTPWPFDTDSGDEVRGDDRARQLAATKWRLETGGSYLEWAALMPGVSEPLVDEARTWLRAGVVTGLVAESVPRVSPYAPGPGEPVDLEMHLLAGGTVTLSHALRPNQLPDDIDQPAGVIEALAYDAANRFVGYGAHEEDPAAALADLRGPRDGYAAPDTSGGRPAV